jgi:hypothetical protein
MGSRDIISAKGRYASLCQAPPVRPSSETYDLLLATHAPHTIARRGRTAAQRGNARLGYRAVQKIGPLDERTKRLNQGSL